MDAHVDEVMAWKRANPADDLLTALIAAEEDGDRLSSMELRDQVMLLFIAGHETTVNLIGTGIYELMRNPDQLELLRADPSLDVNAVEELLRYVSPVQMTRRVTLPTSSSAARRSRRGCSCSPVSRRPTVTRRSGGRRRTNSTSAAAGTAQHLSFGSGAHYCLGSSLARLEAQVAIGSFARRFPNAGVVGEPVWNGRINLRGLEQLHVAVD